MSVQFYLIALLIVLLVTSVFSMVFTLSVKQREFKQKIKLDITKEQMIESEKRIEEFLIQNNIKENYSISEIARIFNVEQGGDDSKLQSQAYLKESDGTGKKIVVFKVGLSEQEREFVFAHELAHLLNGDSVPVMRPNGRNKSHVEQLADYTAAALLMPIDEVYNFMKHYSYMEVSAKKRAAIVRKLCEKYHVTEMIALRRVKEIQVLKEMKDSILE